MEPIFNNTDSKHQAVINAHQQCAETIGDFVNFVKEQDDATYMAKLRFRDPDLSEKEGKDHFFYLWLSQVYFHENENMLSGVFFEVPSGFEKYHKVGDRLGFDPEDAFDWMIINKDGHMNGGFTIRVTRNSFETDSEKKEYDKYIGIKSYESI